MTRRTTGLLLLLAASCTTYKTVLREFDSLAGYDAAQQVEPETLEYGETADRYPWLIRQLEWTGAPDLLSTLLAFEVEKHRVELPATFARDRIASMANVAGNQLVRMSEMCWRLLLVIEKDNTPLNRAVAVSQLSRIRRVFRVELLTPGAPGLSNDRAVEASYREKATDLVAAVEAGWPDPEEGRTREARNDYATALRDLARLDPGTPVLERSRLRTLTAALLEEYDPAVHALAQRYLLRALGSACNRGLAAALADVDPRVRERAVQAFWRAGGARALPLVAATLEQRMKELLPAEMAATEPFDEDIAVRRRVLECCWAADFASVQAQHGDSRSPLALLVDTAGRDPESSLRTMAREALAFHVRRPVDPAGEWIPEWWRNFVSGRTGDR